MRTTSQLYKTLRETEGSYYEVRVQCGQNTYEMDVLREVKILPALFQDTGPKIGGTYSAECDITIKELSENWPRMAAFTVSTRISSADGTQKSEWLSMGTFYTDQRAKTEGGYLRIVGYDKALFLEQTWADKIPSASLPASWPITSQAMAALLVQATGIELDARSTLDNTRACWGLDTAGTARDRWQDIAAMHGGNFIITPEGKIRLVPLISSGVDEASAAAGIAIAGIAIVGTAGYSGASEPDFIPLGMRCKRLTTSPKLDAVTGVTLETELGTKITAGTETGYTLNGICNFADSTGVAAFCLSQVSGFEYQPFEVESAALDPAAEPGDMVGLPGAVCQIAAIEWNLGKHPRANLSAPYEAEIDHEYTFQNESTRTYRKAVAATDEKLQDYSTTVEMNSAIQQTAGSIELTVSKQISNAVGGNLQYGTEDFSTWALFVNGNPPTIVYNGNEVHLSSVDQVVIYRKTDEGKITFIPKPGETYTLSCLAKIIGTPGYAHVAVHSGSWEYVWTIQLHGVAGTEYQRYSATFTCPDDFGSVSVWATEISLIGDGSTQSSLYVKELKIEKGDHVTDWTPSWEDKTTSTQIISTINQSAESITINANKIDLQGYVTLTDLSTSGQTVINGGNITTGEMSADRIKGGTLTLGGSGNVNGTLNIVNASGNVIGTWNSSGIDIKSGSITVPYSFQSGLYGTISLTPNGGLTIGGTQGNTVSTVQIGSYVDIYDSRGKGAALSAGRLHLSDYTSSTPEIILENTGGEVELKICPTGIWYTAGNETSFYFLGRDASWQWDSYNGRYVLAGSGS